MKKLRVVVRSEACDDRGRGPGCGRAKITVDGKDYSKRSRGYNFVILDGITGTHWVFSLWVIPFVQTTLKPRLSKSALRVQKLNWLCLLLKWRPKRPFARAILPVAIVILVYVINS